MDKYDSLKLSNQLCVPLYLASKEIIKKYTPFLNELDLTYTQYIVMMYLWENGVSNVKDITNRLLLESGTLTPLLKKLENKGYIKRVKSNLDERNLDISLTDNGLSLRDKALSIPSNMVKCIDLTEKELKELYYLINKVLNNVTTK